MIILKKNLQFNKGQKIILKRYSFLFAEKIKRLKTFSLFYQQLLLITNFA